MKAFSVFGAEMVELAHLTCNRHNDLKDERRRSQMTSARQVLERSTLMLLISSKTSLRHPDCIHSKENRDTVFCQMRRAMDLIHYVVKDGIIAAAAHDRRGGRSQQQAMDWDTDRGTASSCLRIFARLMESSRPHHSASGTSIMGTSKTGLKDISSNNRTTIDTLHTTSHEGSYCSTTYIRFTRRFLIPVLFFYSFLATFNRCYQ